MPNTVLQMTFREKLFTTPIYYPADILSFREAETIIYIDEIKNKAISLYDEWTDSLNKHAQFLEKSKPFLQGKLEALDKKLFGAHMPTKRPKETSGQPPTESFPKSERFCHHL